jgi:hypothetical protein
MVSFTTFSCGICWWILLRFILLFFQLDSLAINWVAAFSNEFNFFSREMFFIFELMLKSCTHKSFKIHRFFYIDDQFWDFNFFLKKMTFLNVQNKIEIFKKKNQIKKIPKKNSQMTKNSKLFSSRFPDILIKNSQSVIDTKHFTIIINQKIQVVLCYLLNKHWQLRSIVYWL